MSPGDESHWQLLGLDSATATVRDVKRAYAALLKQNRPDENPEGFCRVHEAYQAALRELETGEPVQSVFHGALSRDVETPAENPVIVLTPAAHLPAEFLAAVKKLRAAKDFKSTSLALGELRTVCGDDAVLWREWGLALCDLFDVKPSALTIVATVISNAEILAELRAGFAAASMRILTVWHRERFFDNMIEVGRALTAKEGENQYQHSACGLFALRLAWELAIAQPGGASLLLDVAFRWMPAHFRAGVVPPVDERLRIGRIFWQVPSKWVGFWAHVLDELDEGNELDWTLPEWRLALNDLLRVTPSNWPGWGFLQPSFGHKQWQQIIISYKNRLPGLPWREPPEREWIDPSVFRTGAGPSQGLRQLGMEDSPAPVALAGEIKDDLASPLSPRRVEESAETGWERFRRIRTNLAALTTFLIFLFLIGAVLWRILKERLGH